MTFDRTQLLSSFEQIFTSNEPAHDILKDDKNWKLSFPNELSGPCYTYNPPFLSDPGLRIGMYITMKSNQWDPDLQISFHEENKFFYTESQESEALLDLERLEEEKMSHSRVLGKIYYINTAYCSTNLWLNKVHSKYAFNTGIYNLPFLYT